MKVRIATRGSDLALWQANHVAGRLQAAGAETELLVLKTRGDRIDDVPLTSLEGKGFFTVEIERALLEGQADLAVHSHKDLPFEGPPELEIVAIPERASPVERLLIDPAAHDAGGSLLPLAAGARVGTSAPRRGEQLLSLRPDLSIELLRGNVPTRVQRLREGKYDAIVLAAAGLDRLELDLEGLVDMPLDTNLFVPAPAQGALAIQIRKGEDELAELCRRVLSCAETTLAAQAERVLLKHLGGGCSLPLGVLIRRHGDGWEGRAYLGADAPSKGAPRRWASASGPDPSAVSDELHRALDTRAATGVGPLEGLTVALTGTGARSWLAERLEVLGARVQLETVLETEDLPADLAKAFASLQAGDAVAVTSARAAERLADHALPAGVALAAVGPATARALTAAGFTPTVIGDGGARELATQLDLQAGARVLFPSAAEPRRELEEAFTPRGIEVRRLTLYRTQARSGVTLGGAPDVRIYMSPSAVVACLAAERAQLDAGAPRLGLGRATTQALEEAGLPALDPDGLGPEDLVRYLLANHTSPSVKGGRSRPAAAPTGRPAKEVP